MKKIILTIAAIAAMTACTKTEVVTVDKGEAIAFADAFVDNATKSVDNFTLSKTNLESFSVWGTTQMPEAGSAIVPIFQEVEVSSSDSGNNWAYSDNYTQYWIEGNNYVFGAVKNYKAVNLGNGVPAKIEYDATAQTDLLYASHSATGQATGSNPKVAFNFEHLLSKAYFTVKNTIATNTTGNVYSYRISDIQITNLNKEGVYDISSSEWTVDTEYPVEFSKMESGIDTAPIEVGVVVAPDSEESYYSRLIIPASYAALNITCKIETLLNGDVIDVNNYNKKITHEFVKGFSYNFVLSLGEPGDKIEFAVNSVPEWASTPNPSIPTI